MNADAITQIFEYLVVETGNAPVPFRGPESWGEIWGALCRHWPIPIDRALAGGRMAENLAGAFAAGYQAAIDHLVPDLAPGTLKAFGVTEKGGVHPGAIRTRLAPVAGGAGMVLTGVKTFVTGANIAALILVVCSLEIGADGRQRIVLAAVSPHRPGVILTPIPPLNFVPEIAHSEVAFNEVALTKQDILPGDGWLDYVKPFRTVEDLHVIGAISGYLIGVGRRCGWPPPAIESGLGVAAAIRALALADPASTACHLAIGGIFPLFAQWLERLEPLWNDVDKTVHQSWRRDVPLLRVAAAARDRRLNMARRSFFGKSTHHGGPSGQP